MSVHANGVIRLLDDSALIEVLRKTSLHFEGNNEQSVTAFDNLPMEYRSRLMKAIVAFEIEVTEMNNVFKLSQNRDLKSYNNIIEKLEQQNADAQIIAAEMKKRTKEIFPDNIEWNSDKFLS